MIGNLTPSLWNYLFTQMKSSESVRGLVHRVKAESCRQHAVEQRQSPTDKRALSSCVWKVEGAPFLVNRKAHRCVSLGGKDETRRMRFEPWKAAVTFRSSRGFNQDITTPQYFFTHPPTLGGRTFRPAWINGSTSTWPYGFGRLELCDLLEVAVFRESLDGSWVGLIH